MSPRAAAAASAGAASAVVAYALLRLLQRIVLTEPNPAEVLYSEHAGFFWRSWTSLYVAGMVTLAVWLASASRPLLAARCAGALVVAAAVVMTVAAVLAP